MAPNPNNPVIIQSDRSLLVEVDNPLYPEARDNLSLFAELEKSPEHVHTYRISPLSLWNAAASGLVSDKVVEVLQKLSKYEVPQNIIFEIREHMDRYGQLELVTEGDRLKLVATDVHILVEILNNKSIVSLVGERIGRFELEVPVKNRGALKQALIKVGFPVKDVAGYTEGEPHDIDLREKTASGESFEVRAYQKEAADLFYVNGSPLGGSGVVVLPCGAGKTVVGMDVMSRLKTQTLILTTSINAVKQWKRELIDKTSLTENDIGEYTGECKDLKPVTVTTYNILVYRKKKEEDFLHFHVFSAMKWGLIIYDEVHLLPAPVFRATSEIQARRRLGLTATLVREDGHEEDVFSLIGPKKYDVPWKVLEKQQWIATAECTEIRIPLKPERRMEYAVSTDL